MSNNPTSLYYDHDEIDSDAADQLGTLSPLSQRHKRPSQRRKSSGSIDSLRSSPLDALDDEDEKEEWREYWKKKLEVENAKDAKRKEEEGALYAFDHGKGERDPFDDYGSHLQPVVPVERHVEKAEKVNKDPPNDEEGVVEDIIHSCAQANETVTKETILYSIRTKLAPALALRTKIHSKTHAICTELEAFLHRASTSEKDFRDAKCAGQGLSNSFMEWQFRPTSLGFVSEAVGAWELVDEGNAQGLGALRDRIVVEDEEEKGKKEGGGERKKGKGVMGKAGERCRSQ